MAKSKFVLVAAAIVVSALALTASVFAAPPEGNTRPGYGYGDTNHVHTGPPGQNKKNN